MKYFKTRSGYVATTGTVEGEKITREEYEKAVKMIEIHADNIPTAEDRIEALEAAVMELAEVIANG